MSFITENLSYFFCSNCIFWSNQTPHLFLQMTWHYRVDRNTDLATQWTLLHYIRGRDWKGRNVDGILPANYPLSPSDQDMSALSILRVLLSTSSQYQSTFPKLLQMPFATNPHFMFMAFSS